MNFIFCKVLSTSYKVVINSEIIMLVNDYKFDIHSL